MRPAGGDDSGVSLGDELPKLKRQLREMRMATINSDTYNVRWSEYREGLPNKSHFAVVDTLDDARTVGRALQQAGFYIVRARKGSSVVEIFDAA